MNVHLWTGVYSTTTSLLNNFIQSKWLPLVHVLLPHRQTGLNTPLSHSNQFETSPKPVWSRYCFVCHGTRKLLSVTSYILTLRWQAIIIIALPFDNWFGFHSFTEKLDPSDASRATREALWILTSERNCNDRPRLIQLYVLPTLIQEKYTDKSVAVCVLSAKDK